MHVTGASIASVDAFSRQIDRIVSSPVLQTSESLCKLLRFLAEQAIENPGTPVKEHKIATEVFSRPAYFDPRLDSTVRVQTGRLRSKLTEYYSGVGVEDALIVELPKGSYALLFHERTIAPVGPVPPTPNPVPDPPQPEPPLPQTTPVAYSSARGAQTSLNGSALTVPILSAALLLAVGVIALLVFIRIPSSPAATSEPEVPRSFRSFWAPFLDRPEPTWVVFSNAEFIGSPVTGVRYYNPATDSRDQIIDHYTGVGEVLAVHELDQVFSALKHELRIKRSHLLSLDDVRGANAIFVGSPSENLPLRDIPSSQEFVFTRTDLPTRKGELVVSNVHPKAGEASQFAKSFGPPLTEDYAVIALAPGLEQGRHSLLLAGITTIGTQAAVEFVCRPASVDQLLQLVPELKTGVFKPFEALLRIKVSHGVPVNTQIVALHPRS